MGNLLTFRANGCAAISAVLFTLVHTGNAGINLVAVLNVFLAGLLLGLNYAYEESLVCHPFPFRMEFLPGAVLGYEISGLGLPGILQVELSGNPLL